MPPELIQRKNASPAGGHASPRRDRSEPLISFLRTHGCDTHLVARALSSAGVPRQTRERALAALTAEH